MIILKLESTDNGRSDLLPLLSIIHCTCIIIMIHSKDVCILYYSKNKYMIKKRTNLFFCYSWSILKLYYCFIESLLHFFHLFSVPTELRITLISLSHSLSTGKNNSDFETGQSAFLKMIYSVLYNTVTHIKGINQQILNIKSIFLIAIKKFNVILSGWSTAGKGQKQIPFFIPYWHLIVAFQLKRGIRKSGMLRTLDIWCLNGSKCRGKKNLGQI